MTLEKSVVSQWHLFIDLLLFKKKTKTSLQSAIPVSLSKGTDTKQQQ